MSPSTTITIDIDVTLTPDPGKRSGYQFQYASESSWVSGDGTIDLTSVDKDDVVLVFHLKPVSGVQPLFPADAEQAVWFEEWPKGTPPPHPCPSGHGNSSNTFVEFSIQQAGTTLQFTDKNKNNKRNAYALRCIVPPATNPIADDPVIINK